MTIYEVKQFRKFDTIFREGAHGDVAYVLKEGVVELSKQVADERKVVARLTPISVFGEMALILGDNLRTATARALEDVRAVCIRKSDFDALAAEAPQLLQALLNVLVYRLRAYTTRATHITSITHGLALLLELLAVHGVTEVDRDRVAETLGRFFLFPAKNADTFIRDLIGTGLVEPAEGERGRVLRLQPTEDFAATALRLLHATRGPADDGQDGDDED
ncbi:MAG: cyclic nucleotide-binding domain-containing protein [Desulfovibrionaceae bacterium]|jgi:CRP-like cAMP-binding protein|nr:cyclic nucleotide-binding domain-containing protein [Desulfovibrionaceae bacterium]